MKGRIVYKCIYFLLFFLIIFAIIDVFLIKFPYFTNINSPNWSVIKCDVKLLNLNTYIDIYKSDTHLGTVRGKVIRVITDPLTFYDINDKKIAYADDTYHIISQDSHSIFVDDSMAIEMVGKVKLMGESYDLYDNTGNKIAVADFDFINLNGKIASVDGEIMAVYKANPFLKDFTIYVSPNTIIDETSIIMICSSYYSDYVVDSSSKNFK